MKYNLRMLALRKYDLRSMIMGSQIVMYDPCLAGYSSSTYGPRRWIIVVRYTALASRL